MRVSRSRRESSTHRRPERSREGQARELFAPLGPTYDRVGATLSLGTGPALARLSRLAPAAQGLRNQILTIPNPALPDVDGVPQTTYFLELLLRRGSRVVDRNVYWLSTINDVPHLHR